jgi:hypothetical protein
VLFFSSARNFTAFAGEEYNARDKKTVIFALRYFNVAAGDALRSIFLFTVRTNGHIELLSISQVLNEARA